MSDSTKNIDFKEKMVLQDDDALLGMKLDNATGKPTGAGHFKYSEFKNWVKSFFAPYKEEASLSATKAKEWASKETGAVEGDLLSAKQYAKNAQGSASNASASATSTNGSANIASTKATEASNSAKSASASATTASTKASEASVSASTASTKASEASTSASNAKKSETSASVSASSASTSASTASTKASEASTSASTASAKASEASTSASNAKTSETNAKASENECTRLVGQIDTARIDRIESNLNKEIADRESAVSEESTARTNADKNLQTQINERRLPAGSFIWYTGKTAPTGYLVCQGQAVSRTTYSALFNAIGTIYGDGDGSTTFNLPNMMDGNGRFIRATTNPSNTKQDDAIRPINGSIKGIAIYNSNATGAFKQSSTINYNTRGNDAYAHGEFIFSAENGMNQKGHTEKEVRPYNISLLPLIAY